MKISFFAISIMLSLAICNAQLQGVPEITDTVPLFEDTGTAEINKAQLGMQLGYSKMIEPYGINFGVDYSYFPLELLGVGGKYSFFQYRNNAIFNKVKSFREVITTHFYAPVLTLRLPILQNVSYLFANFSYGFVLYDDYAAFPGYNATLSGTTNGASVSFGFDSQIKKKKYLGLMISLFGAVLRKYEISSSNTNTTVEALNNISRIDVSINLIFR